MGPCVTLKERPDITRWSVCCINIKSGLQKVRLFRLSPIFFFFFFWLCIYKFLIILKIVCKWSICGITHHRKNFQAFFCKNHFGISDKLKENFAKALTSSFYKDFFSIKLLFLNLQSVLKAECAETRSKVHSLVSFTTFCTLLRYALDRMRSVGVSHILTLHVNTKHSLSSIWGEFYLFHVLSC